MLLIWLHIVHWMSYWTILCYCCMHTLFLSSCIDIVTSTKSTNKVTDARNMKVWHTLLSFLKSGESEVEPSKASPTIVLARDLEVPGLPMRNSGILNSMHMTIMKMFSLRVELAAMPGVRLSSLKKADWTLR